MNTELEYIRICPKCGSTSISMDNSFDPLQAITGAIPFKRCNSCGYSAPIFPEVENKSVKKFRKLKSAKKEALENEQIVDTRYGDFYVRALWKIGGPLAFAIGIFIALDSNIFMGIAIIAAGLFMMMSTYVFNTELRPRE